MYRDAQDLSDTDLHTRAARLFLSLRDFHTNYFLPAPYACYGVAFPIRLKIVASESQDASSPSVIVAGFLGPAVLHHSPEVAGNVEIGDSLVSIDGLKFLEVHGRIRLLLSLLVC